MNIKNFKEPLFDNDLQEAIESNLNEHLTFSLWWILVKKIKWKLRNNLEDELWFELSWRVRDEPREL